MTDTEHLKQKFWTALADSPFLFLQLDADPHAAVPMTAQLDRQAHGAIWFFHSRSGPLAAGGPATATFAGKGHDLFARFSGTLAEETDQGRREEDGRQDAKDRQQAKRNFRHQTIPKVALTPPSTISV